MTKENQLRLLVIADSHYDPQASITAEGPYWLGCELVRRAVEDARLRGGFDVIVLLGDLVNDSDAFWAGEAVEQIRLEIAAAAPDTPVLVAWGNHDIQADRLYAAFATRPGGHEIGGYRFFIFVDSYNGWETCTRSEADMRAFREFVAALGGAVAAIQHNPVEPQIDKYSLVNRELVMREYEQAGVTASLSGHYHARASLEVVGGVNYYVAPALCKPPMCYALVTLAGREVSVEQRQLQLPASPPLIDTHVHTEYAYCRQTVAAAGAIDRARAIGLAGLCFVEHAPQLYCSPDDFWAAKHIFRPRVWRKARHSRMEMFRNDILPRRSDFVRIGLEVELDCDGKLTLRDEDRDWADLLVGAVHWLAGDTSKLSDAEFAGLYMKTIEGMIEGGIDVLAHPFRIFRDRPAPEDIYVPLAEMLAGAGVAAEINFHINRPDPAFFAECVARGVKITLGSDSHMISEVGALGPHLDMLRRIAGDRDLPDLLYQPGRSGG